MQALRTIRVVLGEGEPGLLRLILEAQGFEVVGHARDDAELLTVLDVTRPSVVVLDAGISVLAAVAARERAHGAPFVVVWPRDAFTSVAEERVEPGGAILELGNAVRRAVERRALDEPIRIPDADRPEDTRRSQGGLPDEPTPVRSAPGRRSARRPVLVAVAAWVVSLTALGAIGLAIPKAFDLVGSDDGGRPGLDGRRRPSSTPDRGGDASALDPAGETADRCSPDRGVDRDGPGGPDEPGGDCGRGGDPQQRDERAGKGRPDDPGGGAGRGEANGKGNGPDGKGNGPNAVRGKGRPDDPGASGGDAPGRSDEDGVDSNGGGGGGGSGGGGNGGGGNGGVGGGNGGASDEG